MKSFFNLFKKQTQENPTQQDIPDVFYDERALCEITTTDNVPIATGRVESFVDGSLTVAGNNAMPILAFDTALKVIISKEGDESVVAHGSVVQSDVETVKIIVTKSHNIKNERSYFRTKVKIPGKLFSIADEDMVDMLHNETEVDITILDMSLGGVLISCEEELEQNQHYFIECPLPKKTLYIPVEVMRMLKRNDNIYNMYGLQFLEPNTAQIDTLCNFIFTIQTAMQQHKNIENLDSDSLLEAAYNSVIARSEHGEDKKPSMLSRYNRRGIASRNNYFTKRGR